MTSAGTIEPFNAQKARTKRPMPLWVDAFVRDTLDLTVEEIGAFNLLIWAMWSREACDLPDDDAKLATICRVSKTIFKRKLRPTLEPFFIVRDGVWTSKKLKNEALFVEKSVTVQSNRKIGKKPGKALKKKKPDQTGDNPPNNRGSAGEHPTQQPNNPTDNNSEDKSSSLLSSAARNNDDLISEFLEAHPRPRDTLRGRRFWDEALDAGVDPERIIGGAKRYRQISKDYDPEMVKFSDNWLEAKAWEKYPAGAEKAEATDDEVLAFWAGKIKSGKAYGLSDKWAHECITAGLVTIEEVRTVLGDRWE